MSPSAPPQAFFAQRHPPLTPSLHPFNLGANERLQTTPLCVFILLQKNKILLVCLFPRVCSPLQSLMKNAGD
jgi:hypothetical protein